ncbi:MAG: protein kinase domain-containing protein, partial [Gemmatimonadales bacterium]
KAAEGYEVLGAIPRGVGGRLVYFARELGGGELVALRLDQENATGRRPSYTVAATRMLRPKSLYGTIGGGTAPEGRGPWTPIPSPPVSIPAQRGPAAPSGGATSPAGSGEKICPLCGGLFGPEHRFCPNDGAVLRARAGAEELIGQVIAERYHILSKLGEGGMGRVYLAEHVRMGRRCAVKVMNPRLMHDPDSLGRFSREASNASRINHPHVAAIYDFGETADEIVYLAMEFVEGESLAALLHRERGLPPPRAMEIGRQVADALSAAHDLGIVHRDLKPDNVMIARTRDGRDVIKVVDFGIAKATQGGRQTVTRTGFVVGTPAYMSPEQILGGTLDGRSDIYSLGCILYEMLTGEHAFVGSSGEVSIGQRLTDPPPRPRRINRSLSRKLDGIVTTAMGRLPEQRFQSAGELRDALAAALSETPARRGWRGWLHRDRPSAPAPENGPRGVTGPSAGPAVSRPLPAPGTPGTRSRSAMQPPGTAPVPLGWTEAVQPPPQPLGRATTVLRHRSARPARVPLRGIAGGTIVAALVAVVGWRLLTPNLAPDRRVVVGGGDSAKVVPKEPGTTFIPQPADSSADTSARSSPSQPIGPPTVPATADSTPPGTVRFVDPLPPGARVTVDGQTATLSSDGSLALAPGRHTIRVRAPGFRTATEVTEVLPGEGTMSSLRLLPAEPPPDRPPDLPPKEPAPAPTRGSGTVVIAGDLLPGAELSVDGRPLSPGTRAATVAPGAHWVKLSALGYRPDSARVEARPGEETVWQAPPLVPLPRPGPVVEEPPDKPPPKAPRPVTPESAAKKPGPPPVDHTVEVRRLLSQYGSAINARSISQLKTLYPGMSPERERGWRDVFRDEVKDLRATVSVTSIEAAATGPAEASFSLILRFKPEGGKPQTFTIENQATLRQEPGGWRFATLLERGEKTKE